MIGYKCCKEAKDLNVHSYKKDNSTQNTKMCSIFLSVGQNIWNLMTLRSRIFHETWPWEVMWWLPTKNERHSIWHFRTLHNPTHWITLQLFMNRIFLAMTNRWWHDISFCIAYFFQTMKKTDKHHIAIFHYKILPKKPEKRTVLRRWLSTV